MDNDAILDLIFGLMGSFAIIGIIWLVIHYVIMYKLFVKMGEAGWKAFIPIYNSYVFCERIFGNGLYFLCIFLGCVPYIGFVLELAFLVIQSIRLAKSFNKETPFAIGLIFLPTIFRGILAFSDAQYYQLPDYDIKNPFN